MYSLGVYLVCNAEIIAIVPTEMLRRSKMCKMTFLGMKMPKLFQMVSFCS